MEIYSLLFAIHMLGFAFGLGGATVSDVVFVRSVKDGNVTESEYNIIKSISKVVWTSVALLLLSGAALLWWQYYQTGAAPRLGYSYFQVKLTAFAILVVNGLFFHTRVFPFLESTIGYSFRLPEIRARYGMFAFTGGVSVASWYSAFILAAFGRLLIEYPYPFLFNIYALIVLGAGAMAYLVLNKHADESGFLRALWTVLRTRYMAKVIAAGLALSALLLLQIQYLFL